ncbi:Hypothetical predicted protein [Octopus vulgaris]|uniref:Uncharacterized protein n=1 Tax=Octopus vulgaris TaxID=6645 RepID=A0AA36BIX0_OCTVU|nr:Hypothetical predicted protein [Octopus vulgaris]
MHSRPQHRILTVSRSTVNSNSHRGAYKPQLQHYHNHSRINTHACINIYIYIYIYIYITYTRTHFSITIFLFYFILYLLIVTPKKITYIQRRRGRCESCYFTQWSRHSI